MILHAIIFTPTCHLTHTPLQAMAPILRWPPPHIILHAILFPPICHHIPSYILSYPHTALSYGHHIPSIIFPPSYNLIPTTPPSYGPYLEVTL